MGLSCEGLNERQQGEKMKKNWTTETLCIHGGYRSGDGEPQVLPIVQSTTYRHDTPEHLADLFDLKEEGWIYSRIGNPTVAKFEEKIAALEGGIGAVAFSSGQAAITGAILTICKAGDHIVASSHLYGGTMTLLNGTLGNLGIEVTLVDPFASEEIIEQAITEKTKIIYGETIGNPGLSVLDFDKFSKISKAHGLVFMVDNTFATPILCQPFMHGANIVIHSATKYIDGHATTLGGVVVDGGTFDWHASTRYSVLTKPDSSYHGIVFADNFGSAAYITKVRVHALRDFGGVLSPLNAFLLHKSLETLHLRMERHCQNALALALFLEKHEKISWVKYPLLQSHETFEQAEKYLIGASGVLSFGIKGGYDAALDFMKKIDLISLVTHVGDLRTSVLHPASTSHRQLTEKEQISSGVTSDLIRLSVGLESKEDLLNDLRNALR